MTAGPRAPAPQTIVVCDFDGTVTQHDVQHVIFNHFAGDRWLPVNEAWRRGEVTTADRARIQWSMVNAPPEEIERVAESIPLTPGFREFLAWTRAAGWPVHIASDGFDFYIRQILAAGGLADLPFTANHLDLSGPAPAMTFARPNPACCRLGNCKRLAVESLRPAGGRAIYIGDGLSDACGAAAADLVFAKGLLAGHCREKGIPFLPFHDFHDVIAALSPADPGKSPIS